MRPPSAPAIHTTAYVDTRMRTMASRSGGAGGRSHDTVPPRSSCRLSVPAPGTWPAPPPMSVPCAPSNQSTASRVSVAMRTCTTSGRLPPRRPAISSHSRDVRSGPAATALVTVLAARMTSSVPVTSRGESVTVLPSARSPLAVSTTAVRPTSVANIG